MHFIVLTFRLYLILLLNGLEFYGNHLALESSPLCGLQRKLPSHYVNTNYISKGVFSPRPSFLNAHADLDNQDETEVV